MLIKDFDTDRKVMIVAEIGNNHEGSFETAVNMMEAAAAAGADAVKFQVIVPEKLVNINNQERIKRLKSFAFSQEQFAKLSKSARDLSLFFIATPFDLESVDFTASISDALKISSSDNTFYPLIQKCAAARLPVIASTGLASELELKKLVEFFPCSRLALLHCICAYPVPEDNANLAMIAKLKKIFPAITIGYSDHTMGIDAAVLAVAAGAEIIEKHFTLDKNFSDFRDHQLSADPVDLDKMVKAIHKTEILMGNGNFVQECEKENLTAVRRSIVAARPLAAGTEIGFEDLAWVRPGGATPPGNEDKFIGRKLVCDVEMHQAMTMEMFE